MPSKEKGTRADWPPIEDQQQLQQEEYEEEFDFAFEGFDFEDFEGEKEKGEEEVEVDPVTQVFNTPELLEMILLELATDLQQNPKPRKKLEPMHTFTKLRRVNTFFRANIEGSKKLQKILPYSRYRRQNVPAPLAWLFEKELGIRLSRSKSIFRNTFETGVFHAVYSSPEWKRLKKFDKKQNCKNAKWREIIITEKGDISVPMRRGLRWQVGKSKDCSDGLCRSLEREGTDTLGEVFDKFKELIYEAEEQYWQVWEILYKGADFWCRTLSNPRMLPESLPFWR